MSAKVLEVDRDDIVALLKERGSTRASGFSETRLAKMATQLPKLAEENGNGFVSELSKHSKKVFDKIADAVGEGLKIVVTGEEEDEPEEEEAEVKTSRRKKSSKKKTSRRKKSSKKKTSKAPRREPAEKDKFGSREGSTAASINALITKKGISMEKLVSKLEHETNAARIRSHIQFLKGKKLIKVKEGVIRSLKD